eukprot:gene12088-10429_t
MLMLGTAGCSALGGGVLDYPSCTPPSAQQAAPNMVGTACVSYASYK